MLDAHALNARQFAIPDLTAMLVFPEPSSPNRARPINVVQSSNRTSSRPDATPGVDPYADGSDPFQWLNPAAFTRVAITAASRQTVRPGNIGQKSFAAQIVENRRPQF